MGKWVMLSFVGLVCLSIWGTLVSFVFFGDPRQQVSEVEDKLLSEEVVNSTTNPWDVITVQEDTFNPRETLRMNIKKRGIWKEDVAHIAPNGEISIDELLAIVTQKDQH
ncbi:hypothetical protein AWH56_014075 [Anaerobacillus isosaccharinicus]|uniref:Uncharacterized protein n=1 Tax=Anaerobacillus isosaccharinicus TaxID=1532552 RepID=A0A1S2LTB7_9BACI|nr:hypothetical protein [Anaerobacillus isosaccharinicus]MBA5587975.1 hypothetical protein [Anaerobacillus isosaccharinicus]QOY33876.1 hypothetical protein AWH56_014075 [Anaerobacillus isosaccharinicus]